MRTIGSLRQLEIERKLADQRNAEAAYVLRQVMKFCDLLTAHMIEMHPRSFRDALLRTSTFTSIRIERDLLANRTVVMGA